MSTRVTMTCQEGIGKQIDSRWIERLPTLARGTSTRSPREFYPGKEGHRRANARRVAPLQGSHAWLCLTSRNVQGPIGSVHHHGDVDSPIDHLRGPARGCLPRAQGVQPPPYLPAHSKKEKGLEGNEGEQPHFDSKLNCPKMEINPYA